jgi:uncharacterized protein
VPSTDQHPVRQDLDAAECRRLLAAGSIGRLGFTDGALPAIVPVSYTMRDGNVLIVARPGDRIVVAVRGAVVAFQVDDYDAAAMIGWSVTVVGPSRVSPTADGVHPSEPRPTRSAEQNSRCYITVRPGLVRGWRETSGPPVPAPRSPAAERATWFPPVD